MRFFVFALALVWYSGCGENKRDNPADPETSGNGDEEGIQLVANLPEGGFAGNSSGLESIRFEVTAPDITRPLEGSMNLVGDEARALVRNVPVGTGRVFRVDAFDVNSIRTFSAADTVDVTETSPLSVALVLERVVGALELTSQLPPEVDTLAVSITVSGDTLRFWFGIESAVLQERIENIPTGTDVAIAIAALDLERQVLFRRDLTRDIREDLVAHITLTVTAGALQIVANFPEYISIAEIDRFSDTAATFFRRANDPNLPAANEAIKLDDARFLLAGIGPNGGRIEFYHFDVRTPTPAPVYFLIDRRGDPIAGQLPIFDLIPGDEGHNDFWQIHEVRVIDADYKPNTITSFESLAAVELEITATNDVINCVMVPAGSIASKRFDSGGPTAPQDGWYRDQVVKYFLFEGPTSTGVVDFNGEVLNTPQMWGFFDNDRDVVDGFARDAATGDTHNVATRLPGDEGYSPLWILQIFKLDAFDRVDGLASALDQSRNEENLLTLDGLLYINAPIVGKD
jgi:hypothetical protein